MKIRHNSEAVSCSSHGVKDIGVGSVVCVDLSAVGKNNVETDDVVQSYTPFSRSISITAVESMACNADSSAGTVGKSTTTLIEESSCYIPKTLS
jgi:hypothetical protein